MTETVVISAFPQQLLHCQRVAAKSYTSETQPINWLLLVQITVTHFTAINQSVAQCFLPGSELVCLLFWVGPIYLYCVYQNIGFCDAISWANIWQAIMVETHLEHKHIQVESVGQLEQAEQQGPQEAPAGVVSQEIRYHIAVLVLAEVCRQFLGLLLLLALPWRRRLLKVLGVATKVQGNDTDFRSLWARPRFAISAVQVRLEAAPALVPRPAHAIEIQGTATQHATHDAAISERFLGTFKTSERSDRLIGK